MKDNENINERKIFVKKSSNTIINIFCFLCGLVIGLIIAVPFMN